MTGLPQEERLTLAAARAVVSAAREYADENYLKMSIAVVDGGGNLICFEHMDGAKLISTEIAQAKAYTAVAFESETGELSAYAQPGGACYAMESSVSRPVVFWPGGLPLRAGDGFIGAVGAGGGSPEEDGATARAGLAAFEKGVGHRAGVDAVPRDE